MALLLLQLNGCWCALHVNESIVVWSGYPVPLGLWVLLRCIHFNVLYLKRGGEKLPPALCFCVLIVFHSSYWLLSDFSVNAGVPFCVRPQGSWSTDSGQIAYAALSNLSIYLSAHKIHTQHTFWSQLARLVFQDNCPLLLRIYWILVSWLLIFWTCNIKYITTCP